MGTRLRMRLRGLFRRDRMDRELDDELRFHLDREIESNLAAGMSAVEARNAALRSFGNVDALKEEARDARGVRYVDELRQDWKHGVRVLLKSPGFAAVAIVILAAGIGANTVIYSLINALLVRPLPAIHEPEQLVYLGRSYSYPDYEYFRDHNRVFTGLLAQTGTTPLSLNTGGGPELITGELVTADFFTVLGTPAMLGRTFLADENLHPGAHPVAVLSHSFFRRRFASDAGVVGRAIRLNGLRFTVVGVMPRDFIGNEVGKERDVWVPLMMQAQLAPFNGPHGAFVLDSREHVWLNVVGRLAPGVSLDQARAAMTALLRQVEPVSPDRPAGSLAQLELYRVAGGTDPRERDDFLPLAALLLGVVAMVLLTSCSNVANLLLARAAARQKEIGVRIALGATRGRLLRQLLIESLPLALVAGGAGLLLALWLNGLLSVFNLPGGLSVHLDLHMDRRVLLFTTALSLLTTFLFGLAPALHASRTDILPTLKDDAPVGRLSRSKLRSAFVVAQVGLSVLLLAAGGLFLRSLESAQRVNPGFSPERVLLVPLRLEFAGYREAAGRELYRRLLQRMESTPGVVAASLVNRIPLGLDRGRAVVSRIGADPNNDDSELMSGYNVVGPRYCETMGIVMLRGRDFSALDTLESPAVAIINQTLARRLFPDAETIGRRFLMGGPKGSPVEVIGVTADGKYDSLGERAQPFLYRPVAQAYQSSMTLVARTDADPRALLSLAEDQVRAVDPNLAVFPASTMAAQVGASLALARWGAALLGVFGLLGLGLAAVGVFGVMSHTVQRRKHEIGVRMALGARPAEVTGLVLREGMTLVGIGLALGLAAGLGLAQLIAGLLYGVSAADPLTFAAVAAVLGAVAFVATYIPASRAARVDPLAALRRD